MSTRDTIIIGIQDKTLYVFGKKMSKRMLIKDMRSYNRYKERVCTKGREDISIVKKKERSSI